MIDVLRHGEALPSGPGGDASRPLSPAGAARIRSLGARLARVGWQPGLAFTSPLLRARESARLVLEPLTDAPVIETLEALHPEAEPGDVLEALAERGAMEGVVLIVSHMPLVARLHAHLCGEARAFSPGDLATLACFDGPVRGSARPIDRFTAADSA